MYSTHPGHAAIQRGDLTLSRSWRRVPQSVPRSLASQVIWDVVRITSVIQTSLTAITETNFAFTFNSHPELTQWAALFDQWCIPQVAVTFASLEPPGSLGVIPQLYTAVDFDNTTNLGAALTLLEFENAQSVALGSGMSHTRACHPCLKVNLSSSGSSAGVDKMWCDSANPGGTWFGIRSIVEATPTTVSLIRVTQTLWFAFRSGI